MVVGEVAVGGEVGERDVGVEGVVVVADHDLRAPREVERDLERTDFGLRGGREDEVGVEHRLLAEQAGDHARGGELGVVVAREAAVVLVADHLAVGAHARLGAQAQRVQPAARGELAQHLQGHLLLQVLGGQHEQPAVVLERVADRGPERGDRLADAGRRLDQQVLARVERPLDGGDDLVLAGAWRAVGEGERAAGAAALLARAPFGVVLAQQLVEPPPDGGLDRVEVERDLQAFDAVAADRDQHQLGGDRARLELRQHPGVELRLALVEVADRGGELPLAAHRLDLLDHAAAVVALAQPVGAAGDHDAPAPVRDLDPQGDLPAVGRVLGEGALLVAAVDRLAEPEALEAAAVGEADRAGELRVEEVRDRELDHQALGVEARRHGRSLYERSRREPWGSCVWKHVHLLAGTEFRGGNRRRVSVGGCRGAPFLSPLAGNPTVDRILFAWGPPAVCAERGRGPRDLIQRWPATGIHSDVERRPRCRASACDLSAGRGAPIPFPRRRRGVPTPPE